MSSRLIINNLPDISCERLRNKLSSQGCVTDVALKYTKGGKFRRFAYVGFKSEEEALKARNFFDGTYIGTSKITVKLSSNLAKLKIVKNDKELNETVNKKKVSCLDVYKNDQSFEEFYHLHGGCQKDELLKQKGSPVEIDESHELADEKQEKCKKKIYFTVKISGLPYKCKKKDLRLFFRPLKAKSTRIPRLIKGIAYMGFATEKEMNVALSKSRSIMKGHKIFVASYNQQCGPFSEDERWKNQKEQESFMDREDGLAESGRIFIRNLCYETTEEELEAVFKVFGPLTECHLPIDKISRKTKGFAYVTYMFPHHAVEAYSKLDGTSFQGRLLHLMSAKPKEFESMDRVMQSSYRFQKKQKQKTRSLVPDRNWNTLFLGSSAVADTMAQKYSVNKCDVLGEDGKNSIAVRLALGETEIVAETRKFLQEHGVSLNSFDQIKMRSKKVIIVKNLPASTSADEISRLFVPHGTLQRVVLPPMGITALVEFSMAVEARNAFKQLAYSKFKNTPLYLEWAPSDVFMSDSIVSPAVAEPVGRSTSTLFVKNLNFITTNAALKTHFESCGDEVKYAKVAVKSLVETGNEKGARLSMGYGFVQFATSNGASNTLKSLQGKTLDNHSLEIERSSNCRTELTFGQHYSSEDDIIASSNSGCKLIVRNVPFEATEGELRDLFKTFGTLKCVRLPRKALGTHRGFAFVDFHTNSAAKQALDALGMSTHLYGRRLVLEWANQDESVEELRQRTAFQFAAASSDTRIKKSNIDINSSF